MPEAFYAAYDVERGDAGNLERGAVDEALQAFMNRRRGELPDLVS